MRRGRRRLFTDAECAELWRMYKAGESILGIRTSFGAANWLPNRSQARGRPWGLKYRGFECVRGYGQTLISRFNGRWHSFSARTRPMETSIQSALLA